MNKKSNHPRNNTLLTKVGDGYTSFLTFSHRLKSSLGILAGIALIVLGIYVLSKPGADVSILKASVISVKWNNKNECGKKTVKLSKEQSKTVYPCEVVLEYTDGTSKNIYEFSGENRVKYKNGDAVDLYKLDNQISHINPNIWLYALGKIPLAIGSIMVIFSLFTMSLSGREENAWRKLSR